MSQHAFVSNAMLLKDAYKKVERLCQPVIYGMVSRIIGLIVEGFLPGVAMGELCEIYSHQTERSVMAEVVGLRDGRALMIPLGISDGLMVGDSIRCLHQGSDVLVGDLLKGRVINALGQPLDGKPAPLLVDTMPLYAVPPSPLLRSRVNQKMSLGVRAIDGLMTVSKGMRMGIFAGSGVGKSTLLGMALKNSQSDINVVALVGERGREVSEFIEDILGKEGLDKSVVVVSTSDRSPLERVRAAFYATTIAEYFRAQGKDVLLVLDSLTRLAMAQREIGLSIGEPPTSKGYTPTVFSMLPKLVERVCPLQGQGSITGLYTVLVEGDDLNDPLSDAVKSLIDGHVVLSRSLAAKGHFPAIDVAASLSRVMIDSVQKTHQQAAQKIREIMSIAAEAQDLINLGAYSVGKNQKLDAALQKMEEINLFLRQNREESVAYSHTIAFLEKLSGVKITV